MLAISSFRSSLNVSRRPSSCGLTKNIFVGALDPLDRLSRWSERKKADLWTLDAGSFILPG